MEEFLTSTWREKLSNEFTKKYWHDLVTFLDKEYSTKIIYPKKEEIFNALNITPFSNVKVVIIGQDPYHGEKEAHGLAFSIREGVHFPPSLKNIFSELLNDTGIIRKNGNLSSWSEQGVLLLNTSLTVEKDKANSHQDKGWETFTDAIISKLSTENDKIVFILWGKKAHLKKAMIDRSKHLILTSSHPSPLSAKRTNESFFGSKHFSKVNRYLNENNMEEIIW